MGKNASVGTMARIDRAGQVRSRTDEKRQLGCDLVWLLQ
jgi:hypothetical protein